MKLASLAAVLAAVALPAAAQPATPRVEQRQAQQEARIQQGVQSGQLTPREAKQLDRGQAKVEVMDERAKSDGKVSAKERAKLAKTQKHQSRKIHKKKHHQKVAKPAG